MKMKSNNAKREYSKRPDGKYNVYEYINDPEYSAEEIEARFSNNGITPPKRWVLVDVVAAL